jgi:hypothetical protein
MSDIEYTEGQRKRFNLLTATAKGLTYPQVCDAVNTVINKWYNGNTKSSLLACIALDEETTDLLPICSALYKTKRG